MPVEVEKRPSRGDGRIPGGRACLLDKIEELESLSPDGFDGPMAVVRFLNAILENSKPFQQAASGVIVSSASKKEREVSLSSVNCKLR